MGEIDSGSFGDKCIPLFKNLYLTARNELSKSQVLELKSKIDGKSYFAYQGKASRSRPINIELFGDEKNEAFNYFRKILEGNRHLSAPKKSLVQSIMWL